MPLPSPVVSTFHDTIKPPALAFVMVVAMVVTCVLLAWERGVAA